HTPRFWTASAATTIDPEEYYHPHAGGWGLLESDNSAPDIDLRCIKMEFFYFPEYRDLPEQEKRRRRKHEQDVCDQVVYHLLVLKHPVSDEEFFQMARATEPFESPYVTIRRLQERCERLEAIEREARSYANQLEASYQEARQSNDKLRADLDDVIRYKDKLEAAYQEVTRYKDKVEADYLELSRYKGELEAAYHATVRAKEKLEADYQSVQRRKEQL